MKNEHEIRVEEEYNRNLENGPVNIPLFEKGKPIPFSILREDGEGVTSFTDVYDCAFTRAFKRQYPEYKDDNISVGTEIVRGNAGEVLAEISPMFRSENFRALQTKGVEFHTTITFL